jgi:hypothetical protein
MKKGIHLITAKAPNQSKANGLHNMFNILDVGSWVHLFSTSQFLGLQSNPELMLGLGLSTDNMQKQGSFVLEATGYNVPELMRVERVFENSTRISGTDYNKHTELEIKADQYKGLLAVIKVLCEIDGIPPESYLETLAYSVDPDFHPEHPEMVAEAYALAEMAN